MDYIDIECSYLVWLYNGWLSCLLFPDLEKDNISKYVNMFKSVALKILNTSAVGDDGALSNQNKITGASCFTN